MNGTRFPNGMEFIGERSGAGRCINLYARCIQGNNEHCVVVPEVKIEAIAAGTVTPIFMALDFKQAQQIGDELFACGIRPTHGGDSSGVVEAQKLHISDLQNQLKNMWIWHGNIFKQPDENDER